MNSIFQRLSAHYQKNPQTWYLAIAIFGFLVYHFRLDFIPQRADEPTRTVVALEMMLSGNYWTPTINGDWYYRKPPFYNWILVALMQITGSKSDLLLRLPSSIPLFLFGYTIYKHTKRYLHHATAFLAAGMFVTCGRMLIYASFLGHIDIFYSWITYLAFIVLFENAKEGKWLKALMLSYIIHAIAFLCKGLPSVLFAGLTAIPVIVYFANWKQIFGWKHLISFGVFATIISAYFYQYSQFNVLDGWIDQLWDQSAQRTVMDENRSWYDGVLSIVNFPVEHIMHLAPWSLLFPVLFFKGFRKELKKSTFLKVFGLLFLVNIPVYWLSPGYYPRYLFMLYPIVFIFLAHFTMLHLQSKYVKVASAILLGLCSLVIVGPVGAFWIGFPVPYLTAKIVLCVLLGILVFLLFWKMKAQRMVLMVLVLFVFRLSFNLFVLEHRKHHGPHDLYKDGAIEVAKISGANPLYIFSGLYVNHGSVFYMEKEKNEIVRYFDQPKTGDYYIVNWNHQAYWPKDVSYEDVYEFRIREFPEPMILRKVN